jgi:hypothetical protein
VVGAHSQLSGGVESRSSHRGGRSAAKGLKSVQRTLALNHLLQHVKWAHAGQKVGHVPHTVPARGVLGVHCR